MARFRLSRYCGNGLQGTALLLALALSGCGGGGGGGGEGDKLDLSLSPRSLTGEFVQGDAEALRATATVSYSDDLTSAPVVVVADRGPTPVLETIQLTSQSSTTYDVAFILRANLAPGRYASTFHVRVCATSSCNTVYASESVSYVVQITSATNLTSLTPLDGATDWRSLEGPGDANYLPVTLDPARFSMRWRLNVPDFNGFSGNTFNPPLEPVLSADGAAYFRTALGVDHIPTAMFAVNEADGSVRWSHRDSIQIYSPVIVDNVVYTSRYPDFIPAIRGFDTGTGSIVADVPNTRGYIGTKLTGGNGRITFLGSLPPFGYEDGNLSLNLATQQVDWANGFETPAITFGSLLLNYTGPFSIDGNAFPGGLYATDAATGAVVGAVADPLDGSDSPYRGPFLAMVVAGTGEVLGQDGGRISLFDTVVGTRRWTIRGTRGLLAAGEGVSFLQGTSVDGPSTTLSIEAISNETGATLWTWTPPDRQAILVDAIFTRNIAFISTILTVYALDLQTRSVVWSYPRAGALSISRNGVLFINRAMGDNTRRTGGVLIAVNLH